MENFDLDMKLNWSAMDKVIVGLLEDWKDTMESQKRESQSLMTFYLLFRVKRETFGAE